jgi:hypothetical protein
MPKPSAEFVKAWRAYSKADEQAEAIRDSHRRAVYEAKQGKMPVPEMSAKDSARLKELEAELKKLAPLVSADRK